MAIAVCDDPLFVGGSLTNAMLDFTHSSVQAHTALFEHTQLCSSTSAHTQLCSSTSAHTALIEHISTEYDCYLARWLVLLLHASWCLYAVAPGIGPARRFKCSFTSTLVTVAPPRGVHEGFMSTQLGS
jgi:hypothetical protein